MRGYKRPKLESHRAFLEELLTVEPGITQPPLCDPLLAELGVKGESIGDGPSCDALADAQKSRLRASAGSLGREASPLR
jgi:hypothetical protein